MTQGQSLVPSSVIEQLNKVLDGLGNFTQVRSGLSRSSVYKIETARDAFALKRYSTEDFSREKLSQVHDFQNRISSVGFDKTPQLKKWPDGQTLILSDDSWWEISSWKSGEPVATLGVASRDQLRNSVESLAELHLISREYRQIEQTSAGMDFRLRCLAQPELNPEERRIAELVRDAQFQSLIESVIQHSRLRLRVLQQSMRNLAQRRWRCHWILRDIWRQHVLFQETKVAGIIDLCAAAIDSPILDLTRMLGTMIAPDDDRWNEMVSNYCSITGQDFSVEMLRVLDEVSTFLSARNWIMWLVAGEISLDNLGKQSRERWNEIERKLLLYRQIA